MYKLKQSEIRQFHEEGFLIPKFALEKIEVEEVKLALERVLEAKNQNTFLNLFW